MKKSAILIILFVAGYCTARSQTAKKNNHPLYFSSVNQVGLLSGNNGSSFQLQTINGIQYKTWYAGLGVGIDNYYIRSIPVFLDIRKDILHKTSTPFLFADGGVHYIWATTHDKTVVGNGSYNVGAYYDLGLGYKAGLGKHNSLLLSLGYSQKYFRQKSTYEVYYTSIYSNVFNGTDDRYAYTLNRISLKLGWEF